MYLALGIIYLLASVAMAATISIMSVHSIKSNGNFISKKNLFYLAPTFSIIYLLHITAELYNKANLDFFSCFSLINTSLDIMRFKAVRSILMPLCKAFPIYYVDFVVAFVIAEITVILSIASFFSRRIGNFFKVWYRLRKGCDIVLGDSDSAIHYINTNKNTLLWGADIATQRYMDLIKEGKTVLRTHMARKKLARRLKRGEYNIIVFRDTGISYTKVIETLVGLPEKVRIKIYLEANQQEMKILKQKFVTKADRIKETYIAGFSKYELMARRFVVDHPITKYIPRTFFNENCTIKNNKKIHIVFIGFGKVNYQLFRMCAMQFQFAHEVGGKLESHPVQYHIYDYDHKTLHNEFFSRMGYEVDEVFADCDFPRPDKICDLSDIKAFHSNSIVAKKAFRSFVNKDSFTYFIISLKNDLEDASYAQTLLRLLNKSDNYRIFVRTKNKSGEKLNDDDDGDKITYFGDEKDLYTHDNIVNDDLTELAQKINLLYSWINDPPPEIKSLLINEHLTVAQQSAIINRNIPDKKRRDSMLEKWGELPNIEQDSNLYHALNLPFKLNLLGFDMVKRSGENDNGISEAEFNERYVNSGRAAHYSDYSFFFKTESSNVLAFIEHSRWNALYILYDYKQMKKADMFIVEKKDQRGNPIKDVQHKNTDLKQHGCITTYYGLNDLIEFKYKTLYPDETLSEKNYNDNAKLRALSNIYAYDYMDLDRLYSEITAMGYKLVHNGENQPIAAKSE